MIETTQTVTPPAETGAENQGLTHYFCCLEDRGICGTKLGGETIDSDEPAECVVCQAMKDQPCEVTCHPWMREAP